MNQTAQNFISKINSNKYRGEILYLLSQYSTPFVGFLVNLMLLRHITPEVIGEYQSILLLSTYFSFLSLGVFSGLNRNLSYYLGKSDFTKLNQATSSGFLFSIAISVISLIIILANYKWSEINNSQISTLSYLVFAGTVLTQPIIIYFDTLHKTGQDFAKLGRISLFCNIAYLLSTPLIYYIGFTGFATITIFKLLLQLTLLFWSKKHTLNFNYSFKIIIEQIKIGFPLMLNGYLYTIFFQFDQLYISHNFKAEELGYYNLSRLVLTLFAVIPTSIGTILYPKAAYIYGLYGNNKSKLYPFFINSLLVNIAIIIPILFFSYFLIEPLVINYLPKYIPGIPYAKLSLIGGIGYIFIGPSVILGVLGKIKVNMLILLLITFASYGLYFLDILHFESINFLIIIKNIVFFLYAVFIIYYIYYLLKST